MLSHPVVILPGMGLAQVCLYRLYQTGCRWVMISAGAHLHEEGQGFGQADLHRDD